MKALELLLLSAGILHAGVLTAALMAPRALDWRGHLRKLPPFLRQMHLVYGVFIFLMVLGFGCLTVVFAEDLAAGQPLAQGICLFLALFWLGRLIVQLFIFNPGPFLNATWKKVGYHALTSVFIWFVLVYSWAALAPWLETTP